MPRPRLLISDFTGGEVSPRVLARGDLQRYSSSLQSSVNWICTQQGGLLMRCGTQFMGASAASGAVPLPNAELITWYSSNDGEADITFELVGNVLRGWTSAGLVTASGVPVVVPLPIDGFANYPLQYAQRGRKIALTNGRDIPLIITVNAVDDWDVAALPVATFPRRAFGDDNSPPKQTTSNQVTFVGFNPGNTYYVYVGGRVIRQRVSRRTGRPVAVTPDLFTRLEPRPFIYSTTSTAVNIQRITGAILESPLVEDEADVTVTASSITTYTIAMSGNAGGVEVSLVATAETTALRIEQLTNALGRGGEEAAWSYPTVVTNGGNWYQCIAAHVSDAGPNTTANAALWQPLGAAPAWEAVQPSQAWSNASISYGPGDRGFPRCCTFHDQSLILGGSREAPLTLWGSAVGSETNFVLGVEDDEAWSRDLDSKESPAISWLASQQGLIVGTSRGIFVVEAEVRLSPTDGAVVAQSADRCEPLQPVVVGDEIVFIQLGRRQIRVMRWNRQSGPFETLEMSALAEHLARHRVTQLVYAHAPQPVIYASTETYGLMLAIPYSRANNLLAFFPFTFNFDIWSLAIVTDGDGNDDLWMINHRDAGGNDAVSLERMSYPVTTAPTDSPSAVQTKHLDGWVIRTDSGGTVSGLGHLIDATVTVLNAAGNVLGTGTVVDAGAAPPSTPVAIAQPGFEAVGGWTYTVATRQGFAARTGSFGADLSTPAALYSEARIDSANISLTPGTRYRVSNWAQHGNANNSLYSYPLIVKTYNGSGVLRATYISGPAPDWANPFAQNYVEFTAGPDTSYMVISSSCISNGLNCRIYVDDVEAFSGSGTADGTLAMIGANVIIGEAFTASCTTTEPVVGNPAGPAIGNPKHWANIWARIFQSAMPLLNGERPSDYEQADYRAAPIALRSGDYKVNTDGHGDGSVTITQDLPRATQIIGLFGDMQTGTGG